MSETNPERGPLTAGAILQRVEEQQRQMGELLARVQRERREIRHTVVGSGNLDSSGNADFLLYAVSEGFDFTLNRLVINSQGKTPASTMAVSYIAVGEDQLLQGTTLIAAAVRDFAPLPGGTATIPGIFTDNRHQAWTYTSGRSVHLAIVGGTASAPITWALKGFLVES